MSPSTYQVRPAEPGILTEIFLAKRAEFQSGLYQTLPAGLRRDHLRSHFLEADPRKRERIRKFLDSGWTVRNPGYSDEEIRRIPPTLLRVFAVRGSTGCSSSPALSW